MGKIYCKSSPDQFCYIWGKFTHFKQRWKLSPSNYVHVLLGFWIWLFRQELATTFLDDLPRKILVGYEARGSTGRCQLSRANIKTRPIQAKWVTFVCSCSQKPLKNTNVNTNLWIIFKFDDSNKIIFTNNDEIWRFTMCKIRQFITHKAISVEKMWRHYAKTVGERNKRRPGSVFRGLAHVK